MVNSNNEAPAIPSADTLRRLAISESGFVFDPVSGHNFTVNDTGLTILRSLQHEQDFTHLLQELQQEYDANPSDIERDVIEFIGMLREFVGE
ncbi:MAG: hypothetical protein AMJ53_07565 [Gammaproteobacteria bacterium SG8_11]|nr:MAG: hypothetical protein AMJ53_07565 [Gammaproteobacteria bacterium SG8_11]